MLNIKILCVGKIREKSLKDLISEYEKRISKYAKLEIIELEDEIYEDDNYSIYTSNSVSDDKPNIIVIMSESFSDLTVNRKF